MGHAMWLAEVDGLRLLFDPLLDDAHHGGVFEVFPPRAIDAAAIAADFVLISHRHPDHFDLASLRRLAALDPDAVVVTPDDLVASCAARVGFRAVRVVPPETTIELDGPRLVTAPSVGANDPEWGVVVANAEGVVYNQVDTSAGRPDQIRAFFSRVAAALDLRREVTLALARWQPLLEVEAALGGPIGFPFDAYADELERLAALDASFVCPSAAGTRHVEPYGFNNRLVYPLTEARFIEDARARMPRATIHPCVVGASYRVRGGSVTVDRRGAARLVSTRDPQGPDPRAFRPFEIPPIVDPNLDARPEAGMRARIDGWVHHTLGPALAMAAHGKELRYVLEVILPSGVDPYTIVTGSPVGVLRADDTRWDLRCAVAGSLLVDVLDGRRHWGDLLLGGMLRACSRAYHVDDRGLRPLPLQPLFVYEALSYEASVVRALEHLCADG